MNLVSNLFGFNSKNGAGATVAQESVDAAMLQVATTIGDTVAGKDFAGKVIGHGKTVWGQFEKGFVSGAEQSSMLEAAIFAYVAKALAARTGGSVASAARGAGVQ